MPLLRRLSAFVERVRRSDDGQGLAEYALILALIAIGAILFGFHCDKSTSFRERGVS